jgi:hypothetical protein
VSLAPPELLDIFFFPSLLVLALRKHMCKIPRVLVVFERRFGVYRLSMVVAHGGYLVGIAARKEAAVWV